MTDEELADRLDDYAHGDKFQRVIEEAAARLRQRAAPLAPSADPPLYAISRGDDGRVVVTTTPAPSAEWVAEAMRLADEFARYKAMLSRAIKVDDMDAAAALHDKARRALEEHLKGKR